MFPYLAKRIALLIPILFVVVTIVFFFIHMIPGDPVDFILGEQAESADKAALRSELRLDLPLGSQYLKFLGGIAKLDWGDSIFDRRPVLAHIRERYGATVELALAALAVSLLIAIPAGVFASLKKYSFWDSGTMFFSLLGVSMPNFWLGPLMILLFSIWLGWLPVAGRGGLASLVLPAFTLGAAMSAMLSRMTRASMLEVLEKEYVTTARAKGLKESRVILKHALRNALNPVVTIVGLQMGTLLAGAVVTEKIFNWPGLGSLLIESIQRRDYAVVQGCVLVIALGYVAINTLTDCLYRVVDPRVRLGA